MNKSKPTKDFSSKQEKQIADYLGWNTVAASGARDCHPGDVRSQKYLGECKTHTTSGQTIVFYRDVWEKLCKEAISQFKTPVYFVDDGSQELKNTWCVFPKSVANQRFIFDHFPGKVSKNLRFENIDMRIRYRQDAEFAYVDEKQDLFAYESDAFGETILICSLETFKEIA